MTSQYKSLKMNEIKAGNNGCAHMAAKAHPQKPTLAATSHIQPLVASLKNDRPNDITHRP
jgi:hypothetical protein